MSGIKFYSDKLPNQPLQEQCPTIESNLHPCSAENLFSVKWFSSTFWARTLCSSMIFDAKMWEKQRYIYIYIHMLRLILQRSGETMKVRGWLRLYRDMLGNCRLEIQLRRRSKKDSIEGLLDNWNLASQHSPETAWDINLSDLTTHHPLWNEFSAFCYSKCCLYNQSCNLYTIWCIFMPSPYNGMAQPIGHHKKPTSF